MTYMALASHCEPGFKLKFILGYQLLSPYADWLVLAYTCSDVLIHLQHKVQYANMCTSTYTDVHVRLPSACAFIKVYCFSNSKRHC